MKKIRWDNVYIVLPVVLENVMDEIVSPLPKIHKLISSVAIFENSDMLEIIK